MLEMNCRVFEALVRQKTRVRRGNEPQRERGTLRRPSRKQDAGSGNEKVRSEVERAVRWRAMGESGAGCGEWKK